MKQPLEFRSRQIAGQPCQTCRKNIVLATEGKFCTHCGVVIHLVCEPAVQCGACGRLFDPYEPPTGDPLREALLPPALRVVSSSGPLLAIFAAIVFSISAVVVILIKSVSEK